MRWIVSVKPAEPGENGPHLVSDDPYVVQAVIEAIIRKYLDPKDEHTPLRILPDPEPEAPA